jgi:hypothetical protein
MKRTFILLATISFLIFNCSKKTTTNNNYYSSDRGAIVGVVHPAESQAQVSAYLSTVSMASTQIAADGYFELSDLPLGTYSLRVQAEGHHDYLSKANIEVRGDATASVDTIYLISVNDLIASVSPFDGAEKVSVSEPIRITFRTTMDRSSVEGAFKLEPSEEGEFSWYLSRDGWEELRFMPRGKWVTSTLYQVTIDTTASDQDGNKLLEPFVFSFTTERLRIMSTYPPHWYTWAQPNTEVRIRFNADMNIESVNSAFHMADDQMNAVQGSFNWYDSDDLTFRPYSSLRVKTFYTVTIDTSASEIHGGKLQNEYRFAFITQSILIATTSPGPKQTWVPPSVQVIVVFNTDMETKSAESAFTMVDSEENEVEGEFRWSYAHTLEFDPDLTLAYEETYTVSIDTSAKDMYGVKMDNPFSFWFMTRPE